KGNHKGKRFLTIGDWPEKEEDLPLVIIHRAQFIILRRGHIHVLHRVNKIMLPDKYIGTYIISKLHAIYIN
ncbi:hypothetical protein ACJX0J_035780, partial [Zea mays]